MMGNAGALPIPTASKAAADSSFCGSYQEIGTVPHPVRNPFRSSWRAIRLSRFASTKNPGLWTTALRRCLAARPGDVLVVRWVDRLGRNYRDVCDTIRELMRRGVVIKTVINGMVFDGSETDPVRQAVRDALIGFMAALSQAQAEATKIAQRAGIEHAAAHGSKRGGPAYLGRKPSFTRAQLEMVCDRLGTDGIAAIARDAGLSRQTVYRVQADRAGADAAGSLGA